MILKIQIYSFIVSYIYGFAFFILLEINSKFIYSSSLIIKILSSLLFIIFNTLLYFIILMKINNGYLHIYFFLSIILGYISCKTIYKKIVKRNNLWYT